MLVWHEVGGRQILLLTYNRKFSAVTISVIEKQHW
jgi:hypothetical protein